MTKDIEEILFLDPKKYNRVKTVSIDHHFGARAAFYLESKGLAYVSMKKKTIDIYDIKDFNRVKII